MHDAYTSEIVAAMQQAIDDGTPVNPPIWWVDPTDSEAQKINDGKFVRMYRFIKHLNNSYS